LGRGDFRCSLLHTSGSAGGAAGNRRADPAAALGSFGQWGWVLFPQPPNSQCVANERVVPAKGAPFDWAVFVVEDLPDDVIAFYSRALGRPPDEAGNKWGEPGEQPLHSLSVHPVERIETVPPSARGRVPPGTRTLIFLVSRSEGAPPRQPYQDNVLPNTLSPAALLEATRAGRLVWARSAKGPVLKAGGRAPEGLHSGREIWITIGHSGRDYVLTLTSELRPYGEPLRQKNGWFSRCELAKLWEAGCGSVRHVLPDS